jgi:hypothetical protein
MQTEVRYHRPWLYPAQQHAIFNEARYCIIEASTKAGKTVGCIVWLTEQAVRGRAGQNFWWVAPIYGQAKIAFRRLKRYLPRGMFSANEGELTITLPNGAAIWFKGADNPDALFGEDVYAAVVDEATRCKEEAWHAVRSTLTATGGPVRIIGNVKGRRNWAYHLARKAEAGEAGMHYAKLTAWDAVAGGVLAAEEIQDAQRLLPAAVFAELYMAEPSDDGGNPFGIDAIRAIRMDAQTPGPVVAWGLDLAKSQDWTVLFGLNAAGRECAFHRWQKPWRDTIRDVRRLVARVPCLVDSTGVGDPVLEELQADGGQNFTGYKFTQPSKQQLMEGLAVAIQKQEIGVASPVTIAELEAFEYEYTRTGVRYSAPQGVHDDCVMGLGLARQCLAEMGRAPVPSAWTWDE